MTEYEKLFLATFPPRILNDIIQLVESKEINRSAGRLLLDAYMHTHDMILASIKQGVKIDINACLNKYIEEHQL